MKALLLLLYGLIAPGLLYAQMRGVVYDAETKEPLPYVLITANNVHALSGLNGEFALEADETTEKLLVAFRHSFYADTTIYLSHNAVQHIYLIPKASQLKEVEIVASQHKTETGTESTLLTRQQLQELGSPLGEPDLIRAFQATAGVLQTGETKSGLFVRGGTNAQTAILLQGVPVFNSAHLLGINSSLDPDAYRQVRLYKSGFPAPNGGWLSAYLLAEARAPDVRDHHLKIGLGVLSSEVAYQRYLPGIKTSIYTKAKSSYYQLLAKLYKQFQQDDQTGNTLPDYAFGDVNVQVSTALPQGELSLMLFGSQDRYKASNEELSLVANWGNRLLSARWKQMLGTSWVEITQGYSSYTFSMEHQRQEKDRIEQTSRGIVSNLLLGFPLKKTGVVEVGAFLHMLESQSAFYKADKDERLLSQEMLGERLLTGGLFSQVQLDLGSFTYTAGSRLYGYDGRFLLAPRLAAKLTNRKWANPGLYYDRTYQFHHQVNVLGISMPFDFLRLASSQIPLQQADQLGLGVSKEIGKYQIAGSLYHRWLQGQLYYPNATALLNNFDQQYDANKGRSYGAEFELQAEWNRLQLTTNYTLAYSKLAIQDPQGETKWVFPVQDVRHQFNTGLSYRLGKGWRLMAQWFLQTGSPYTFPVGIVPIQGMAPKQRPHLTPQFEEFNNIRTAATHRLDMSATYTRKHKWGQGEWNFGVYNVYNRANPYFLYIEVVPQADGTGKILAKQRSLLPVTPTIRYTWSFAL